MADEQRRKGLMGRLFSRAQERRREARRREEVERRRQMRAGAGAEEGITYGRITHPSPEEERARREFAYRETGGGYGGYGGELDRGDFRPAEGHFGAGFSDYGPRRPWEEGGAWQPREGEWRGGEFRGAGEHRRGAEFHGGRGEAWRGRGAVAGVAGPAGGAMGAMAAGGETWRGREWHGGRERWRGAEFRGGGAETWRRRRAAAERWVDEDELHPHGLGDGVEGRRMERGYARGDHYGPHIAATDRPRGLGSLDEHGDRMERGYRAGQPGEGTVEPVRGGGWGGGGRGAGDYGDDRNDFGRSRRAGGGRGPGGGGRPARRFAGADEFPRRELEEYGGRGAGGYGTAGRGAYAPPRSGAGRGGMEERELQAERVGPGTFRRRRDDTGATYGAEAWRGDLGDRVGDVVARDRARGDDAGLVGEHYGRYWEGGSAPERTGRWFAGRREPEGWTGSGPDSERTSDWFGGAASEGGGRPGGEWYGGGVHEARDDRTAQDFGNLGGPAHGRFGREEPADRGGGRGFGGPLGRWEDRSEGEQGPLHSGQYRGREDEFPVRGEAIAGRGHVGSEDFRDLATFGEGRADRGSHERYEEHHEEGDHYRSR